MSNGLAYVVTGAALVVAAWAFLDVLRDRLAGRALLGGLALVEGLLVAQVVVAAVKLAQGDRPDGMATFIGYLVASLLVLPFGTLWALGERSRSGTAVLGVSCLVVPVLVARLLQIWDGGGG